MQKILLVEDNPLSQKMMFYTFRHEGISVDMAADGQEAVEKGCVGDYDIILMDIQMPVYDGYEATQLIRKHESEGDHSHKSFIVGLTCNVYDEERQKCQAAGMDEYLPKPFDMESFKGMLSRYGKSL